jgi:deferrochelatase/peroxidase EfeB
MKDFIPQISTSAQVLKFNQLFNALRSTQKADPRIKATWVNVAFSYAGIQKIAGEVAHLLRKDFVDQAFKQGLAARSESLGDDTRPGKPGNKKGWKIGGPNQEADVIFLVASDDPKDTDDQVKAILSTMQGLKKMKHSQDRGGTLPAALGLKGHEHFGFLDGVSQPGIRGHKAPGTGPNPILGQNNTPGQDRRREFVVTDPGGTKRKIVADKDWVVPTGGGYFFARRSQP